MSDLSHLVESIKNASGERRQNLLTDLALYLESQHQHDGPKPDTESALLDISQHLLKTGGWTSTLTFAIGKYPSRASALLLGQFLETDAHDGSEDSAWQWLVALDNVLIFDSALLDQAKVRGAIQRGLRHVGEIGGTRIPPLLAAVRRQMRPDYLGKPEKLGVDTETILAKISACSAARFALVNQLMDLALMLEEGFAEHGPSSEIEEALEKLENAYPISLPPVFFFALGKFPSPGVAKILGTIARTPGVLATEEAAWQWLIACDNFAWSEHRDSADQATRENILHGLKLVETQTSERIQETIGSVKHHLESW